MPGWRGIITKGERKGAQFTMIKRLNFKHLVYVFVLGYAAYLTYPVFTSDRGFKRLLEMAFFACGGAIATMSIYETKRVFGVGGSADPALEAEIEHLEITGNALQAECEALRNELSSVQKEADRLLAENAALLHGPGYEPLISTVPQIQGETFQKLVDVIEAFPAQYPNPEAAKLNDDIRPWIKEKTGCSDREVHVFGAIVAEHFSLRG